MNRDPVYFLSEIHFSCQYFTFPPSCHFQESRSWKARPRRVRVRKELARWAGQWQSRTFGAEPASREPDQGGPAAGRSVLGPRIPGWGRLCSCSAPPAPTAEAVI